MHKLVNHKYGVKHPWERNLRFFEKSEKNTIANNLRYNGNQEEYHDSLE